MRVEQSVTNPSALPKASSVPSGEYAAVLTAQNGQGGTGSRQVTGTGLNASRTDPMAGGLFAAFWPRKTIARKLRPTGESAGFYHTEPGDKCQKPDRRDPTSPPQAGERRVT